MHEGFCCFCWLKAKFSPHQSHRTILHLPMGVWDAHVLLWTSVGFLPACWYQLQENLGRWGGWGELQTKALEHYWHSGNLVSVSPKAVRSQLELKHLRASRHRFKVQTNTCLRAPCGDGRWAKTKRDLVNIPSLSGRKNRFAWDGELGEHITALLSDSDKSSEFPSLQTKSTDLIEMGGRFI